MKEPNLQMPKTLGRGAMLISSVLIWILASLAGIDARGGQTLLEPFLPEKALAAEPSDQADKTLSPYFFVKSDDPSVDQLPLKSTSAVVDIAGVIADVKVTQVYRNEGKRPLEAVYIFPASTRAAVYAMQMTIGERTIKAEIQKREEARAAYEQAKQQGKSASLLEQQRPNVFQMNVANILPGDEIKTELHYTELITPVEGIYEFVYPTVVGPRYSNQPAASAPPSEKWVQNPYLHEGHSPTYTFDISAHITAGLPIREMTCTSHKTDVAYEDPSRASVKLTSGETSTGNKDFILKYRLSGDHVDAGMLLYEGDKEKFFLLMMQPPKRVALSAIPPREYIFIVDVSGSMHGFPLEISKRLLKDLIGNLRPTDTFDVLLFSGGSQLLAEKPLPATAENIRRAVDLIERQQGGGGTELLPALKRVLALPKREGVSRTVVIATDGFVTVEPEVFDLIRKDLGQANFFPFGIGSSVNRHLIEGMARVGKGEPFVITKPDEAPARAERFRQYVQSPVLTRIHLDFGGFQAYDIEPPAVPDVFSERPVIVCGKWRGRPEGKITLRGLSGEKAYEKAIDAATVKPSASNSALRYLWARSRITELSDYNSLQQDNERVKLITTLGLEYNLLTSYTSFVAIDTEVRRKDGELTTVKQPLPLPEGVSNYAVGEANLAPMPMAATPRMFGKSAPAAAGRGRLTEPFQQSKTEEGKLDTSTPKTQDQKEKRDMTGCSVKRLAVTQGLSEADVRQVIEQHLNEIQDCCSKTVKPGSPKELIVKIVIDSNGNVIGVQIPSPKGIAKDLAQCIREKCMKWRFSAPVDVKSVTATATLSLQPSAN